jgi:hypothetical protein
MTTICMICHCVKSGQGEPISHGICYPCRLLVYGVPSVPALMKPKPDPYTECPTCRESDLDDDGVATGCRVAKCIMPDRRDPWSGK